MTLEMRAVLACAVADAHVCLMRLQRNAAHGMTVCDIVLRWISNAGANNRGGRFTMFEKR